MNIDKLSPELLGLVLDKEVFEIRYRSDIEGYDLNLDTLTRLMIELLQDNGYSIELNISCPLSSIVLHDNHALKEVYDEVFETSIFEAVLEATLWFAKEKELI